MKDGSRTDEVTGLEAEILGEKIATYVRIARTLERLVAEAEQARRAVAGTTGALRRQRAARFGTLREQARTYLWYLVVQREALGLRHHAGVERAYPIPRPLPGEES